MTVFLGVVVSTAPEYGIAIVDVIGGSQTQSRTVIGYLPCNDSATGTIANHIIPTGSTVICAAIDANDDVAYIISQANYMVADVDNSLMGRANYNIGNISARDYKAIDTIITNLLQDRLVFLNNHAHNMDIDAMTGDLDIHDYDGSAGLHIGKYIAQLKGSALSYIDLAGISNKIRIVASTIEQHNLTTFTTVKEGLISTNVAINATEAFGSLNAESPIEIKDNIPEIKNTEAIPFYRIQNKLGYAVDGEENIVVAQPPEQKTHTATTEPIILAKKKVSLNGAMSTSSAKSIYSIKSPDIVALHQVAYGISKEQPQDDILVPYEEDEAHKSNDLDDSDTKQLSPEDIRDASLNKVLDKLLSDEYVDKLLSKLHEHGLILSSTSNTLNSTLLKDGINYTGPITNASYDPPFCIELTDPATGVTTAYYKSTSFITQEPDGSILLKDGYGSEIRMSQGNIYISPALDLFLRPGRDLSAMVPRHQAFNSQYTCTINSGGDLFMRASTELKVAAGTSGSGSLVLEGMGTTMSSSSMSGINIKSYSGVAVTGDNIYIGYKSEKGIAKKTVSNQNGGGAIVVDAGGYGSILLKGMSHTIDSSDITMVASDATNGSMFTMNKAQAGLYTTTLIAPIDIIMRSLAGIETAKLLRNGEKTTITLNTAISPSVELAGHLITGGPIECQAFSMFHEGLAANGVVSAQSFNMVPSNDEKVVEKYFEYDALPTLPSTGTYGEHNVSVVLNCSNYGPYQDFYINGNSFSFPITYDVDTNIVIPGMWWQKNSYNSTLYSYADYVWNEEYIKDVNNVDTACYPGISIWESATVSLGDNIKIPLKDSYITNTHKK